MISWEAPSRHVPCTCCRSIETQVTLEFLTFTRYMCRQCGESFVIATGPSADGDRTHAPQPQDVTTDRAPRMSLSAGALSASH